MGLFWVKELWEGEDENVGQSGRTCSACGPGVGRYERQCSAPSRMGSALRCLPCATI